MAYVAPDWRNNQAPAINADNLQAISDTLELVPIENGGSGMTGAQRDTLNVSEATLVFWKWGKMVMMQYIGSVKMQPGARKKLDDYTIPDGYRPAEQVHMMGVGYKYTGDAPGDPQGSIEVGIGYYGWISIHAVSSNPEALYPYFTATWIAQ